MQHIFDKLWKTYTTQNPSVQNVYDLFITEGEKVTNDHIAFRTYNDPRIGVDVLAKVFIKSGYVEKGQYHFEDKKLFAKHYEHTSDNNAPRVFISELLLEHFSDFLKKTVTEAINKIPHSLLSADDLIYSGRSWGQPSYEIYKKLLTESEYAAWLYVYGFCANHFTVSVNRLKKFSTLESVNELLKKNGFLLNDSGGEIKGTPSELLEQSSTRSGLVSIDFIEGRYEIPGCYYEFARRYPDHDGQLFSGFIAKSADKIFESTNFYQKK
jgi:hypothetical protein